MPFGGVGLQQILFELFGGLAVFIYGMNLMGEGLQKAAGERMRKIINFLTGNPILAVIVGALVTALMQSSSATTVMVVGFVSARLMTLPQAIGVIMGANIGTTVTAQLIAFKIGSYAYPIAAIGFIFFFFVKKKIYKYFGQTVFAFGLLFIGLNTMGDAMKPLAQDPAIADIILKLVNNPVYGLLAGTIMTAVIQSSSATMGILQNLAEQPIVEGSTQALINLPAALPVLFGNNIGTTITAFFASIGAKINAKRAAFAHIAFNLFGALLFLFLIPVFSNIVEYISPKGLEINIINRQIANAHTIFNVLNTIVWLPFIVALAKVVTLLVPGNDEIVENRIIYLDNKMLKNPSIAMDLATKELTRMAMLSKQMMACSRDAFLDQDTKKSDIVFEIEETVDMLQDEIIKYLSTMLSSGTLTDRQSIRLAGLMHITGDIERIGDHCKNIAEFALLRKEENVPFSDEAISEMSSAFEQVKEMVEDSINALSTENAGLAKKVTAKENEIDIMEEQLRSKHIIRLNRKQCNPRSAIIYAELVHNLERIADHCNNIAEAVIDDQGRRSL